MKDWTNDELIKTWVKCEGTGKARDEALCDQIEDEIGLRGEWIKDTVYDRNTGVAQDGMFTRHWDV